ncbi:hypothetical protein [Phenylobacterium sp.]|jgi:hypothetical protein|uniref:hypothetical protein n=1 Tax=Phenylobacterium sp. TaxID=1871053 RepID=UPI002F91EA6D
MLRFRFFDQLGVAVREDLVRDGGLCVAQDTARALLEARGYTRAEIFREGRMIARLSDASGVSEAG